MNYFISGKFTNILKDRIETESVFLMPWLNDEVTWMLSKGSNIHLPLSLLLFFFLSEKQIFHTKWKEILDFNTIRKKCTYLVRFIFFSVSPSEKRTIYMHSSAADIFLR